MIRRIAVAALVVSSCGMFAQAPAARPAFDAFDVATVKPVDADAHAGRMFKMEGLTGGSPQTTR